MKKMLFGFVLLLTLVAASMANGASSSQEIHYSGVWCKTLGGANGVGCVRENGNGYSIGLSKNVVLVMRNGKRVFARYGQ